MRRPLSESRRGPTRSALTLLGLALVALGVYALARGYGFFGDPDAPLLEPAWEAEVSARRDLAAVVALLAGVGVGLAALAWFIGILRPDRPARRDLLLSSPQGRPWRATVRHGAIEDAIADELVGWPDIDDAQVQLLAPRPDRAALAVRLRTRGEPPAATVERRVRTGVLARIWPVPEDEPGWPELLVDLDGPNARAQ
jgi:hypothetical protein